MRKANVMTTEACAVMVERHLTPEGRKRWQGQAAWDAENLRSVGTKLRVGEYDEFRRLCRRRKISPYRTIGALVRLWIDEEQAREREEGWT